MKYLLVSLSLLFLTASHLTAQTNIAGQWEGGIKLPNGAELIIVFNLRGEAPDYSGTLDIPQQNATGLRLSTANQVEDSVTIVFTAGQTTGTFTGRIASPNVIEGTYVQGGQSLPFYTKRSGEASQLASAEFESSLLIKLEDVQVGGTLTLPDTLKSEALVIMSSGSGPQDRDETLFGFKIFAAMASHLGEAGIASYRYDDRGIGESSGDFVNSTLEDLSADLQGIIDYFISSGDYSFKQVVLLGHSQGGIVAGKVARNNDKVAKLILMASPSEPLSEIVRVQAAQGFEGYSLDTTLIVNELDARDSLMAAVVYNKNIDEAVEAYEESNRALLNSLSPMQRAGIPDIDAAVRTQSQALTVNYGLPSLSSFLFYDPADDLRSLTIPVLALMGGKDTQVTIDQNRDEMEAALSDADVDYTIRTFPEANHLFQKANSGDRSEYSSLEKAFVDDFLTAISEWILSD